MTARQERQLVEILRLAATGDAARAFGLSAEHLREFPDDAAALALLTCRAHPPGPEEPEHDRL